MAEAVAAGRAALVRPGLRPRQLLGKYRIERRIAEGGFAEVYRAQDTIEGVRVALKIPHAHLVDEALLADFRREVRLTAPLDHPNVLPIKNAQFIDGRFVIAYPLGTGTLGDRMLWRLASARRVEYAAQMLAAVAHAHQHRIIHCDLKPENFILFPGDRCGSRTSASRGSRGAPCWRRARAPSATWRPSRRWAARRCAPTSSASG